MKIKVFVLYVLISILCVFAAQAVVIRHGVLRAVFPDRNMITIDQQRYQLAPGAPVYRQSNPEVLLPLTTDLERSHVMYNLRHVEGSDPIVLFLVFQD